MMDAFRVRYTILNYDCWRHYKDFDKKKDADNYAAYLEKEPDTCDVSVEKIKTDKLYNV